MSLETFISDFEPYLVGSARWGAFQYIAARLYEFGVTANILETGCVRKAGNWHGDGQSTLLWERIARDTGGQAFAVDISRESCHVAGMLAPTVLVICADSIRFICERAATGMLERFDLLYLDSFDFDGGPRSSLHHAGELAAAYDSLRPGCLIAVDDCHSDIAGKHTMVAQFFRELGVAPVYSSYVTVWEKP